MLSAEQNDRITRIGPDKPAGRVLRRYWQPAALVDELDNGRPIKPVKLLGEDLVVFRDDKRRYGLLGGPVRIAAPTLPMDVLKMAVCAARSMGGCLLSMANACKRPPSPRTAICAAISGKNLIR
jgi:hypothetical protein